MREFFRGWKRKVGVLTLGIAMILAWWWARSLSTQDYIQLVIAPDVAIAFVSEDGAYSFWRGLPLYDGEPLYSFWRTDVDGYETHTSNSGEVTVKKLKRDFHVDPNGRYWPIVIAWTIISACLLFSKQPPAKQLAPPTDQK